MMPHLARSASLESVLASPLLEVFLSGIRRLPFYVVRNCFIER
jgi:hypothetical protein